MKDYQKINCIVLLLTAACSKPEDPDAVKQNDKIELMAKNDKRQLKADGKDLTCLVARLPTSAGEIDVTFTTTGGTFLQSDGKSVKDYADSVDDTYRYATAWLKADTLSRQVYATAEVAKARNQLLLTFAK